MNTLKTIAAGVATAGVVLLTALPASANIIYKVSSTSVVNCGGAPHGLWTNGSIGGGSCSNYFDIDGLFNLDNTDANPDNWTAKLTGTAVNPQGKVAVIDIDLSDFVELGGDYKKEGGVTYNGVTDTPDIDFFETIVGTIVIDGVNYVISNFMHDFQFGPGANAKDPNEFGGAAWISNTDPTGAKNAHGHWDLNLTFSNVPAPAALGLFGLGLAGLGFAGRRRR